MSDKVEMIELECSIEKVGNRSFPEDQAKKMLAKGKRGGWFLPAKSKYQFDKENGFTKKSSTGASAAS